MKKVWIYSIAGILCAGGLYTEILNHVEQQVTIANDEKIAYLKKIQERNELINELNGSNQKLYQLELTYNQVRNETNQKNTQIATLKSDVSQIQNKIKTISSSNQKNLSSAQAPAPVYSSGTSSTVVNSTNSPASKTTTQPQSSVIVSPTPPPVQSTTKASG